MNYKFSSTLTFVICIYSDVKVNAVPKMVQKPQVASSSLNIGYVDIGYFLEKLPEAKKYSVEIQSFQKQLDNQIRIKMSELEGMVEIF